jgi:hypothetical protein
MFSLLQTGEREEEVDESDEPVSRWRTQRGLSGSAAQL